jgi:hypothetical protein
MSKTVPLIIVLAIGTFAAPFVHTAVRKNLFDYLSAVFFVVAGVGFLIGAYGRASWTGGGGERVRFFSIAGIGMLICGIIILALKCF